MSSGAGQLQAHLVPLLPGGLVINHLSATFYNSIHLPHGATFQFCYICNGLPLHWFLVNILEHTFT